MIEKAIEPEALEEFRQRDGAMELAADAPRQPNPFGDGYKDGQHDLLFALAREHQWATDKLAAAKLDAASEARLVGELQAIKTALAGDGGSSI